MAGVFRCRWCRKRLVAGAEVCHHCGREQHPAGEASASPDPGAEAVKQIAARLEEAGMSNRAERLRATVRAMDLVHAGESVDDAVAAVLPG